MPYSRDFPALHVFKVHGEKLLYIVIMKGPFQKMQDLMVFHIPLQFRKVNGAPGAELGVPAAQARNSRTASTKGVP